MAINNEIYKPLYEYSYGGKVLFTTTDTLPNLMQSEWQKNNIMDDTNVYTTFTANDHPLLCGATTSSFVLDYKLAQGESATDGVKEINVTRDNPYNVNLRYIYKEQTVYSNGTSMGFRWTGYNDDNYYETLRQLLNSANALVYPDLNITRRWSKPYEANDNAIYLNPFNLQLPSLDSGAQQFVTSINRDNLFFEIVLKFAYIDENNQIVKLSNVTYNEYKDWLQNDTTGFITLQGHDKCFCTEIIKYLCVNDQNDAINHNNNYIITSAITKKDLATGNISVIGSSGAGANIGNSINILCEKYNNSSCYYYTAPMCSNNDGGIKVPYNRAYFLKNNFTMRASNGSTNDYTYQTGDAFSYSHSELPNFNKGFMTIPFEDIKVDPNVDEFYAKHLTSPNRYEYKLYGRNIMSATYTDSSTACREVHFYKFAISGKEIMANQAITLIPFAFANGDSLYVINKNTNPDMLFIGIRNNDGTVSGKYEKYVWGVSKPETDFRPDDYKPINPIPDAPIPDPDREQIKPPNREGNNISLHLDNRFGAFNGFLTLYNLTEAELGNFGSSLMGNPLNYRGNFQKDLSDNLSGTYDVSSILNYIVSVKMYPFSVGSLPNTSIQATSSVYIGTGEFGVPIGTECRTLTSSISLINAGSLYVAPLTPYMDFRDYYNTTIVCYLPYCGSVELNPMDIMNTTLQCYYLIDFLTGECTAVLYSIGENNLNYPVAIANGNIGIDIPLSATNSGQLSAVKKMQNAQTAHTIISYINSGLNIVNDAITLGTSNALNSLFMGGKQYETREKTRAITSIIGNAGSIVDTAFSNSANPYGANRSARSAVATPLMPTGSGATNFMLNDSVYLQIRRGTYSRPNNYGSTIGYPNTFSTRLLNVSGLTYCTHVNVSGINCTQEEKYLIKSALEGGTIL